MTLTNVNFHSFSYWFSIIYNNNNNNANNNRNNNNNNTLAAHCYLLTAQEPWFVTIIGDIIIMLISWMISLSHLLLVKFLNKFKMYYISMTMCGLEHQMAVFYGIVNINYRILLFINVDLIMIIDLI
jgi:hypothetical protein